MESWLTTNEYTIPEGASDAFDPSVQGGSYFFVAKVKADEVTFRDGNAALSPVRFYYDTPTLSSLTPRLTVQPAYSGAPASNPR